MPVVRSNSTALSLAGMLIEVVGNQACEETEELHPTYCGYLEVESITGNCVSVWLHKLSVRQGFTCCSWEQLKH